MFQEKFSLSEMTCHNLANFFMWNIINFFFPLSLWNVYSFPFSFMCPKNNPAMTPFFLILDYLRMICKTWFCWIENSSSFKLNQKESFVHQIRNLSTLYRNMDNYPFDFFWNHKYLWNHINLVIYLSLFYQIIWIWFF